MGDNERSSTNPWNAGHSSRDQNTGAPNNAFTIPARPTNAYDGAGSKEKELQERERTLDAREKAVRVLL